mgnify:CR=1 FL=1
MKIKETEIKNSKSHALAYFNPSLFCFLGSGGLYPYICSYTCYYVVLHGSHDWSLQVWIYILLIIFKFDLKRVHVTKNRNASILFLRHSHSHNRRVENASFFQPECFCDSLWSKIPQKVPRIHCKLRSTKDRTLHIFPKIPQKHSQNPLQTKVN